MIRTEPATATVQKRQSTPEHLPDVEWVIELSSLSVRAAPIGEALLHAFALPVIVRLSIDPTPQAADTMSREVEGSWLKRPGRGSVEQVHRRIGWSDVPQKMIALREQLPLTVNSQTLTEQAGGGVAALLVSDLEQGRLHMVLPIGSGGDYLVRVSGEDSFIQLEVSGLREDRTGSAASARLREKTAQVLTHARVGFVSVTTFSHGNRASVHSYHHFVRRPSGKQQARKKSTRGRKRKKK
jgi:hypothetical protein